jgi:hypothetical protein
MLSTQRSSQKTCIGRHVAINAHSERYLAASPLILSRSARRNTTLSRLTPAVAVATLADLEYSSAQAALRLHGIADRRSKSARIPPRPRGLFAPRRRLGLSTVYLVPKEHILYCHGAAAPEQPAGGEFPRISCKYRKAGMIKVAER